MEEKQARSDLVALDAHKKPKGLQNTDAQCVGFVPSSIHLVFVAQPCTHHKVRLCRMCHNRPSST